MVRILSTDAIADGDVVALNERARATGAALWQVRYTHPDIQRGVLGTVVAIYDSLKSITERNGGATSYAEPTQWMKVVLQYAPDGLGTGADYCEEEWAVAVDAALVAVGWTREHAA